MNQAKQLWKEIMEPPGEFSPVPFWFFNDEPDEARIRLQLEDFVAKGIHAFVLHPRIGIPEHIPYLSSEYFDAIRFIVKTASELDMKVVLYDEGMYPSGSAHGMVVRENPEFASKGITVVKAAGELTEAGIQTDNRESLCGWTLAGNGEAMNGQTLAGNREIVARLKDGSLLVYGFTGGTIRGIHFGEDDGEDRAPKSADILNPEAVRAFIRLTHERYYEELKEYFGTTVCGFFTDEPCALGRNASDYREWVPGLEVEIREAGGDPAELAALFENQENPTTRIYHRLIKRHLRETFYRPLSDWCEVHGIALMGHPAESDDIEEELYFHVPGQDLILRRVEPMTGGLSGKDSVQGKLTADIARLLGCRKNMNECFGVCSRDGIPWYFTGGDMKWYIDWLGIRGVNLFVPHAFYYSIAGKRKEERPPDVGPMNIWWPHYRYFSDYMKRISWLMTDSKDYASVAVLCDNNNVPAEAVAGLYENQVGFHYLPISMVKDVKEEAGRFCIGDCCYEVILNVLGEECESLFVEKVLSAGEAFPAGELSLECDIRAAFRKVFCNTRLVHTADEILVLAKQKEYGMLQTVVAEPPAKDLRAVRRIKGEEKMIFLSNEGGASIQTRLFVAGIENPVWIDLWEGKAYACRQTDSSGDSEWIEVLLRPCETALIVADPARDWKDLPKREIEPEDWTGRFKLRAQEENRRIYGCTVVTNEAMPVPEYFQVAGEEMAEWYCNGELAGVSFWQPHIFAVGERLKEGKNDMEIIMTGNAANLYAGADVFFGLKEKPEGGCNEINL